MAVHHQRGESDSSAGSEYIPAKAISRLPSWEPTNSFNVAHETDALQPSSSFDGYAPESKPFIGTYASSFDRSDEPFPAYPPDLEASDEAIELPPSDAVPATSRDFSELFPSSRKLQIHHDDTTVDGNMNLRVDTPVRTIDGRDGKITLFHMRMYDLKSRDMSLRRYCRDSGREICHSARKSQKHAIGKRPGLQRSLSNAFAAMMSKADIKSNQQPSPLVRADSGYDSMPSDDEEEQPRPSSSHSSKVSKVPSSETISIEFSNYAHVDVSRKGYKADKHYDFHYWGSSYAWRKTTQKIGHLREVSYHLERRDDEHVVARIIPEPLSDAAAEDEIEKGGWIPPCTMWINDQTIIEARGNDVADVVVATGLVVLVDDSIRRRFHSQEVKQLIIPLPMFAGLNFGKDSSKPKKLIDDTFQN